MKRTRAAASSIARGIPSRRSQISAITARSPSEGENAASAASARSQNSRTPSVAADNDGTAHTRSPATPSGSRLVASTVTVGHDSVTRPTSSAAASSRCSQLSRITSRRRPRRASTTLSTRDRPSWGRIDRMAATACATAAGSATGASSHNHTPSGNLSATIPPASSARRVLPTPPTPVSVISRRSGTSAARRSSSSPWPTKLVAAAGKFPARCAGVRSGGNPSARPGPHTWNSRSRLATPASSCSPRSMRVTPVGGTVSHQFLGGLGHDDLAAVSCRHQVGGPVHRRPDIVTLPLIGRTRVDAHPHPHLSRLRPLLRAQSSLCLHRGRHRIPRRPERRRERVTGGREHVAAVLFDHCPEDPVMGAQGRAHRLRRLLPQAGRALHVGEQERHRPVRPGDHALSPHEQPRLFAGRHARRGRRLPARDGRPGRRPVQSRSMPQDVVLQLGELRAGIEAELVREPVAELLEGGQRVRLAPGPVQAHHQQGPQPFPQRIDGNQPLQLRHQLVVSPERNVGFQPRFHRRDPQRIEALRLVADQLDVGDVGQRRAAPQRQPLRQQLDGDRGPAVAHGGAPLSQQTLEAPGVEVLRRDHEPVPGFGRHQHPRCGAARHTGFDGLAQLADVVLESAGGGGGRTLRPDRIHERVRRHHLAGADDQHRQQHTLLGARRLHGHPVAQHFERPQDTELDPHEPASSATRAMLKRC